MKLVYFGTPDMAVPPLKALIDAGHDVVVLESEDAVGGRIRTDRVDGFLIDPLLCPADVKCDPSKGVEIDCCHVSEASDSINSHYKMLATLASLQGQGSRRVAATARLLKAQLPRMVRFR